MTFFAVAPHMHELGQHFTASLRQGDEEKILYDDAFNEDAQKFAGFPEVQVHEGDVVDLSCDWFNPTAMPVTLGSAATQEMCSAFIYRYPAGDSSWCMDYHEALAKSLPHSPARPRSVLRLRHLRTHDGA